MHAVNEIIQNRKSHSLRNLVYASISIACYFDNYYFTQLKYSTLFLTVCGMLMKLQMECRHTSVLGSVSNAVSKQLFKNVLQFITNTTNAGHYSEQR